jgi:hypothetical protein
MQKCLKYNCDTLHNIQNTQRTAVVTISTNSLTREICNSIVEQSMGERRGAYRALVEKPEGRRPLGRPRRRCEDNIKMDLREVGWGAWTGSIWLRTGTGGELLCIR